MDSSFCFSDKPQCHPKRCFVRYNWTFQCCLPFEQDVTDPSDSSLTSIVDPRFSNDGVTTHGLFACFCLRTDLVQSNETLLTICVNICSCLITNQTGKYRRCSCKALASEEPYNLVFDNERRGQHSQGTSVSILLFLCHRFNIRLGSELILKMCKQFTV